MPCSTIPSVYVRWHCIAPLCAWAFGPWVNTQANLQLIKVLFFLGKSVIISNFIGEHAQDDPSGRCFIGVQWSGVCILVIAHLCVSSYVRWASNGNIKQPLGVLVAGHFASEKKNNFFGFARTLHAPSASFIPAQETTIEHMLASERLSEHSDAWVKQNHHSLYHFN